MKTIIYVVRHGNSVANSDKVFAGHTDSPLSELGEKQASYVTEYFEDKQVDVIYSSDLSRAVSTVKGVADSKGLAVIPNQNLREIYAGKWENLSFDTLQEKYGNGFSMWRTGLYEAQPDGGESVQEMAERVFNALTEIAKTESGKTVVIATHSTPLRSIVSKIMYGTFARIGEITRLSNASITKLCYEDGVFTILDYCITEHLKGLITVLPQNI